MGNQQKTLLARWTGRLMAFAACTAFVWMDIFAQYLLVIDPIDPLSLMVLRMIPSAIISYAYLYYIKSPDLPFGPKGTRRWLVLRSINISIGLQLFFVAVRHIAMSDAMIIYQSRPFFLGYVSEWWLGEPMTKIQKIASGLSILGETLIAKPTLLFHPPANETIVDSGPGSVTHTSVKTHFTAWGMMFFTMLTTVFDLLILRKLNMLEPFLLLGMYSLASVILSGSALLVTQSPLIFPSSPPAWCLLFLVQSFGILTQILQAETLKRETAVTMSLVTQFQVVPAALGELVFFGNDFSLTTLVGASMTTVAGVWAVLNRAEDEGGSAVKAGDGVEYLPLAEWSSEDSEQGEVEAVRVERQV